MAWNKAEAGTTPEGLETLRGLARRGLSDEDIAKAINVNRSTIYAWKKTYPEISNALKEGELVADLAVESALFKKSDRIYCYGYVARFTKDCYCYTASNKNSKSKLFPKIKKNAVVDVMKYTEKDSTGKKWYFVRIPFNNADNADGFVFEFVPQGYFKRITTI